MAEGGGFLRDSGCPGFSGGSHGGPSSGRKRKGGSYSTRELDALVASARAEPAAQPGSASSIPAETQQALRALDDGIDDAAYEAMLEQLPSDTMASLQMLRTQVRSFFQRPRELYDIYDTSLPVWPSRPLFWEQQHRAGCAPHLSDSYSRRCGGVGAGNPQVGHRGCIAPSRSFFSTPANGLIGQLRSRSPLSSTLWCDSLEKRKSDESERCEGAEAVRTPLAAIAEDAFARRSMIARPWTAR